MEIKVRAVGEVEQKSMQEIEGDLLEKHEESLNDESVEESPVVEEVVQETPNELKEEDVLSYIKNRYDKQIDSVDQLFEEKSDNEEMPEDVSAYFEYKKKTGRGIEDYVKLNRDFNSMDDNNLLKEYLIASGEAMDDEDVDTLMSDYSYDEDIDEDRDIKKKRLAKKKIVSEAKKFFNEQKEMYKQPLESSTVGISEEEKKEVESYKQYIANAKTQQEEGDRMRSWFLKKTDEVFDDFKGFDFKVGDTNLTFNPGKSEEIKNSQLSTEKFIGKFLDDKGLLNDAKGYHKSLAVAMNPDKFANFFYEQGKSDATDDVTRKIKNIKMSERKAPEVTRKDGTQFRAVSSPSSKGLKIRSIKNKN